MRAGEVGVIGREMVRASLLVEVPMVGDVESVESDGWEGRGTGRAAAGVVSGMRYRSLRALTSERDRACQ